jgi:hypothetical protein
MSMGDGLMADGDVHVLPVNDLIDHTTAWDCLCGPLGEDHDGTWLYIHHSLDGREHDKEI